MGFRNLERPSERHIGDRQLKALAHSGAYTGSACYGLGPEAGCPADVDWDEVAAGVWPEWKARQLIAHAALCAHCGFLLRAATSVDDEPTPKEEKFLAKLKAPVC